MTRTVPPSRQTSAIIVLKLGLEAGDYDWYQTLRAHWLANGRTAAEADRLFERMARRRWADRWDRLMRLGKAGPEQ